MIAEARVLQQQLDTQYHDIIVIGTGPAGMRFVTEFVHVNTTSRVAVFGDEPWLPYNRVNLTSLLTGAIREDKMYVAFDPAKHSNVSCYFNNRIVKINRHAKTVIDSQGVCHGYTTLVLATGSSSFTPNIPGTTLKNVFSFHDLCDAQKLMSRIVRSRHTIVIGGGLLGLEAARAMQRFNTNVTVIEHSMWLMFRQLDQRAGSYLKRHLESLGVHVLTSERVLEIYGDDKVQGVLLGTGETIECDTVVLAAGIVPNLQLIRNSGLYFGKGIRVNDYLQTNDPNIYAIGECAEHRKKTYGLVTPGYEQARVLAYNLNGGHVQYTGSTATTSLKVLDYPVFSIGEVDLPSRNHEEIRFQDHHKGIYRRLFLLRGRLRGVVAIGAWPGILRMQEAVTRQQRIWPWQVSRFIKTGVLWTEDQACNVASWPNATVICQCMSVTRAHLAQASHQGVSNVEQLIQLTGAATVCGVCRPLLANFMSVQVATKSERLPQGILAVGLMILVSLLYLVHEHLEFGQQEYRGLYILLTLCGLLLGGVLLHQVIRLSRMN